jgi:hypothetical protein
MLQISVDAREDGVDVPKFAGNFALNTVAIHGVWCRSSFVGATQWLGCEEHHTPIVDLAGAGRCVMTEIKRGTVTINPLESGR